MTSRETSMFSVTQDVRDEEQGTWRVKVLLAGFVSENEAWNAGHSWLMEKNLPHVALDIRQDGEVIGLVSWEP